MMNWRHTLIAGSAIILLANALALLGAAYNRSGDPESQLRLTQRELRHSEWREGKENSGMTLELNWRIEQERSNGSDYDYYPGRWGMPGWLGKSKLSELGFDVDKLARMADGRRHQRMLPREALLVLENNDQSYQRQLHRAWESVEQAKALAEAKPDNEEFKRRLKTAEANYRHEQQNNSRLFVIDAGLDLNRLRAAYPDRNRYAIVHGLIRPAVVREKNEIRMGGYISELHAARINAPLEYRPIFGKSAHFEAAIAFGKRLEPWIISASKSENY